MDDKAREAFEARETNKGQWPRAVERDARGQYLLAQVASAWLVWKDAIQWQAEQQKGYSGPAQRRAVELHEKASMPWDDAHRLALSEAGIDDAAVDELIGECSVLGLESLLTTPDDLREFTRSVLVHQPAALQWAASQQAAPEGWRLVPVEPTMEMRNRGAEVHDQRPSEVAGIYRAMLAAAPAQQAAEGWRPISEAPKDWGETLFDVWAQGERVADCWWGVPTYGPKTAGIVHQSAYDSDGPVDSLVTEPTHWRSRPAAPTAQGEREPFLPGELERMTENGRKAWAGVDPQSLRDGSYQAQGERDV